MIALLCLLSGAQAGVVSRVHTGATAGWSWQQQLSADVRVERVGEKVPLSFSIWSSVGVYNPWQDEVVNDWGLRGLGTRPYAGLRAALGYVLERPGWGVSVYFPTPIPTVLAGEGGPTFWLQDTGFEFVPVGQLRIDPSTWVYVSAGSALAGNPRWELLTAQAGVIWDFR